jgi:hypothetical protein
MKDQTTIKEQFFYALQRSKPYNLHETKAMEVFNNANDAEVLEILTASSRYLGGANDGEEEHHAALREAAHWGFFNLAKLLLSKYPNQALKQEALKYGFQPHNVFWLAIRSQHVELSKLIYNQYENDEDREGALENSVYLAGENMDLLAFVLEQYESLSKYKDNPQELHAVYYKPLCEAAGNGNVAAVELIFSKYHNDEYKRSALIAVQDGSKPLNILSLACSRQYANTARLLVAYAIDINERNPGDKPFIDLNKMLNAVIEKDKEKTFGTKDNAEIIRNITAEKQSRLSAAKGMVVYDDYIKISEAFNTHNEDFQPNFYHRFHSNIAESYASIIFSNWLNSKFYDKSTKTYNLDVNNKITAYILLGGLTTECNDIGKKRPALPEEVVKNILSMVLGYKGKARGAILDIIKNKESFVGFASLKSPLETIEWCKKVGQDTVKTRSY